MSARGHKQLVKAGDPTAAWTLHLLNSVDEMSERRQAQPERGVDRCFEEGARHAGTCEIEDGARRGRHGKPGDVPQIAVQRQRRGVDDYRNCRQPALPVAADDGEVDGWVVFESIEAMQASRRGMAHDGTLSQGPNAGL